MVFDVVVEGGVVVAGAGRRQAHVYIEGGRVALVTAERHEARRRIDADGLYVLPGMIDGHCHFQDPGDSTRENFITGSSAAAVGGVTTVIEHTHSDPVIDVKGLDDKANYLRDRSLVDFALAAHAWPSNTDQVGELWRAGAAFFKVFTCTTHGVPAALAGTLLRLFRNAAAVDALCLVHCEDEHITADNEERLRAAGRRDALLLPEWRSREAEEVAASTVALLARLTGARTAIAHVSRPAVLEHVERERARGARLWAEACPQYFYLREDDLVEHGPFRKFTPPARSAAEAEGLWPLLAGGALTHISSDHAPVTAAQKREGLTDIWQCHFGLPGVQTTLTMMLNAVNAGHLTLERLAQAYAEAPAALYGLAPRKGRITPGADADLVLVDLGRRHTLHNDAMLSKAGWTPYDGRAVTGAPMLTMLRGAVIAEQGAVAAEAGTGQFLPGAGFVA